MVLVEKNSLLHMAQAVTDGTGKNNNNNNNSLIHLAQAVMVTGKNITTVLYVWHRLSQIAQVNW